MCGTCGCSTTPNQQSVPIEATEARTIQLEHDILEANNLVAARNRHQFAHQDVIAINLMSSPGSGKTAILERTIRHLGQDRIRVIEGDQATDNDAERIRSTGCEVIQINTGKSCHLEAEMIEKAIGQFNAPTGRSFMMIENVGNLVCPAMFDLGEHARVIIASTTEGEDKPLKYPHMFRAANLVLLNKMDLLPYVDFSVDRFHQYLKEINPDATVIEVSAKDGTGFDDWYGWLLKLVE